MVIENTIAYTAVLIQLVGVFFYIKNMYKGTTKPNRVTWIIWALAPLISSYLMWQTGARLSILPVFMAGFNPVLVLLASFVIKKGFWQINKFDIVCGMIALLALVLWIVTRNLSVSIIFAILSDFLAALPTLVKSWKYPDTETSLVYAGGIVANILGLLIIKNWSFPTYSPGIYFIIINFMLVFSIYRKKIISYFL
ncbi:MAG: hypothetical protein WC609_03225 [Candidatus Paceibacterota bacterium]|jgi:hypothetical protein